MGTPRERSAIVKRLAASVGFDRCGVAPAVPVSRADYVRDWLASGRGGTMAYLQRHVEMRLDPGKLLPGARSVIVVALNYNQDPPVPIDARDEPRGRVSLYAWGGDYHKLVKRKLFALSDQLRESIDEPFVTKACVDTAPVLERELAAAAGIGWIGKNTLVLNESLGSYFFLGAVVTTLELAYDDPSVDHCGSCTACLEACPTQAFPTAYEMNASRCISYLTIEHREAIDPDLHRAMGDWVFGCDVCQEVCPHNRKAPRTHEPGLTVRDPGPRPSLPEILNWSNEDYRNKLKGSALKRATYDMWRRNAGIALSNAKRTASGRGAPSIPGADGSEADAGCRPRGA